jgi:glycerol-3-phosphate acyltransferase PlsX
VLDAMGGDDAPQANVAGAVHATRSSNIPVILVGPNDVLDAELRKHDVGGLPLSIHHAPDVIDMHDPATAVRQRPDSSIRVACDVVKAGEGQAVVSAGHSGATMAAALMTFGRIPGISRPALIALVPARTTHPTLLIDMGANADCKPQQLLQFGLMGSIYSKHVYGVSDPCVGLLSIGEEPTKGNELSLAAYALLQDAPLTFVGNVEGRHILSEAVDVVVCDGYTGNVALKTLEGAAEFISNLLKSELRATPRNMLGALLAQPAFNTVRARMNYEEYGGAPLVGLNSPVIIAHGRSTAKAMANTLHQAYQSVAMDVTGKINQHVAALLSGSKAPSA